VTQDGQEGTIRPAMTASRSTGDRWRLAALRGLGKRSFITETGRGEERLCSSPLARSRKNWRRRRKWTISGEGTEGLGLRAKIRNPARSLEEACEKVRSSRILVEGEVLMKLEKS